MHSAFFPQQERQQRDQGSPGQQHQRGSGSAAEGQHHVGAWAPSPAKGSSLVTHTNSPVAAVSTPRSVARRPAVSGLHTRALRFPSSRRYLWDRTAAGPQVLVDLLDYLPHVQMAVSAFGAIARAARGAASSVKLQLSLSVSSTHQINALIQEHDPLGAQAGTQLLCPMADAAAVAPADTDNLRAALQAQLDQRDIARVQQMFALSASAAAAASPDAPSCLQLQLLMPQLGLLATPLYTKRLCHVPLAEALLKPGCMAHGQTGYLSMDQARSLLPLEATDANVYTTPLVGVWVKGPASVLHPLVAAACLRFAFSSLLMDRAVNAEGAAFLLLLCPEGDPVSKCFEVCVTDSSAMPLASYRCEAGMVPAAGLAQYPDGIVPAQWVQQRSTGLQPLPGPLAAAAAAAGASRPLPAGVPGSAGALALPPPEAAGVGSPATPGLSSGLAPRSALLLPAERASAPSAPFSRQLAGQRAGVGAPETRRSLPLQQQTRDVADTHRLAGHERQQHWAASAATSYDAPQPRAVVPAAAYTATGNTQPRAGAAAGGSLSWRQQQQQQQWVQLGDQLLQPSGRHQQEHDAFAAASAPPLPEAVGATGAPSTVGIPTPSASSSPGKSAARPRQQQQQPQQQVPTWSERQQEVLRGSLESAADALRHSQSSLAAAAEAARGEGCSSMHGSPVRGSNTPAGQQAASPVPPAASAGSPQPSLSRLGQQQQRQQQAAGADANFGAAVPQMGSPVRAATQKRAALAAAGAAASPAGGGGLGGDPEPRSVSPAVRASVALSNLTLLQQLSSGQLQRSLDAMPQQQQQQRPSPAGVPSAALAAGVEGALHAGSRASSTAAAAMAAASAAVAAMPASPYGPSLGSQRYAADAAAMQAGSRSNNRPGSAAGLWSPNLGPVHSSPIGSGHVAPQGLSPQQQLSPQAPWLSSPPSGVAGSGPAGGGCSSPWQQQQQQQQQQLRYQVSPVSPSMSPGGWSAADPVAQALQDEVDRLRQELQQLQRHLRMAGMSVLEAGISVAPPAASPPPALRAASASPAGHVARLPVTQRPVEAQGTPVAPAPAAAPVPVEAARQTQPFDTPPSGGPADVNRAAPAAAAAGQAAASAQQRQPVPDAAQAVTASDAAAAAASTAAAGGQAAQAQSKSAKAAPPAGGAASVHRRRRKLDFGSRRSDSGSGSDSDCSSSSGGSSAAAAAATQRAVEAQADSKEATAAQQAAAAAAADVAAGSPIPCDSPAPAVAQGVPPAAAAAASPGAASPAAPVPATTPASKRGAARSSLRSSGGAAVGASSSSLRFRASLDVPPLVELVRTRAVDLSDDSESDEWEERLLLKYGLK